MKYTPTKLSLYQVKIFLTTKCSLRCGHCVNSNTKVPKVVATVDYAKQQIDFIRSMGVKRVELGILVGDSFEYPIEDFKQIIQYLESLDDIEFISISSSLQFLSEEFIEAINYTNKLKIQLSWYGKDDEEYQRVAGFKRGFTRLLKNVELLRQVKTKVQLTVISMFPEKTQDNPLITLLSDVTADNNISVTYDDDAPFTNWDLMLSDTKVINFTTPRRGACDFLFADMGIDENGDVLSCAWFDYSRLVVLGNINANTPEEIYANHLKIVKQHELGIFTGPCRNCTVYSCSGARMD